MNLEAYTSLLGVVYKNRVCRVTAYPIRIDANSEG